MIHSLAVVHPDADIHPQAFIGPWCMVEAHVRIGADCELISHVVVKSGTTMGEKNKIYPFVVLGAQPQDLKYQGEPTELLIGSSNVIRENVTMNLGTIQGGSITRVGDNCLIMAYSHLGHDCQVGNSCILSNYAGLAGHVVLEDYVTLGGMVGIAQFVKIGKYAYIGAQSGLERDIPPFVIAVGCRPTLIKGVNIVGLRRRGMTTESIQILNEAIKLWTRVDVLKETSLNEIHAQYGEVLLVKDFIDFIRTSNGVIR